MLSIGRPVWENLVLVCVHLVNTQDLGPNLPYRSPIQLRWLLKVHVFTNTLAIEDELEKETYPVVNLS